MLNLPILTTNLTASCIFMSIHVRSTMKRSHYRACMPHMHVVFSMFETAHMYNVHVYTMIHVRRTPVRRTYTIV